MISLAQASNWVPRPLRFLQRAGVRAVYAIERGPESCLYRVECVDSRPCKKRKDGAPDVPVWERNRAPKCLVMVSQQRLGQNMKPQSSLVFTRFSAANTSCRRTAECSPRIHPVPPACHAEVQPASALHRHRPPGAAAARHILPQLHSSLRPCHR